jgi:phosphoribosylamine--glycine ligase
MQVLVVGSGGREHALCWALANNGHKVWCAPGNPGTALVAHNVPIEASDISSLVRFAKANEINLVLPGTEVALSHGIRDAMDVAEIPCFGPTRQAAQLETSKAFTKQLCRANNIPTAQWASFDDVQAAEHHVERVDLPVYIKADGLAGGKGAVRANTEAEALDIIRAMMRQRTLGNAGRVVVIEEALVGEELSFFAFCNGSQAEPFGLARDYKRLDSSLTSPNTGGMGAYTLSDEHIEETTMDQIILPTLRAMVREDQPFFGMLYAGLMLTESGPKLIEYNVRFGDPECQAMLMTLDADLCEVCYEVTRANMPNLTRSERTGISVVMTAPGYPQEPQTGSEIRSIEVPKDVVVFQAGTCKTPGGRLVAKGGRVLNICTAADTLPEARDRVYAAIRQIDWPEGYYRHDIGE